jgi:hypothetical protein
MSDKYIYNPRINATWHTYNGTETLLKSLVYQHGAAVVSIHASDTIWNGVKPGKIYESCTPKQGENRDHAVAVVGYGDGKDGPYWLIRNSWGTNWGDQGYFKLRRGSKMCGIGTAISVVTCYVDENTEPITSSTQQSTNNTQQRVSNSLQMTEEQTTEGQQKTSKEAPKTTMKPMTAGNSQKDDAHTTADSGLSNRHQQENSIKTSSVPPMSTSFSQKPSTDPTQTTGNKPQASEKPADMHHEKEESDTTEDWELLFQTENQGGTTEFIDW